MTDTTDNYVDFFAADGPLARRLPGFSPRPQQQAMAEAVGQAIDTMATLAVEAGTGVGKTFAYLVPALLSGRRVIISTGTKNLQDQLFGRDIPLVTEAIGAPAEVALLKGRANYLCLHRLDLAQRDATPGDRRLARIAAWSLITRSGDIAELPDIREDAAIWPRVTSTVDNCLGADCPVYERCFVVRARREAQRADVVIVNHYLLLADLALKERGFGDLLPAGDACILDEAHQVPEIAARFFGASVAAGQLRGIARDAVAEAVNAGLIDDTLDQAAAALEKAVADLKLALGEWEGRHDWDAVAVRVEPGCATLDAALASLREAVERIDERPAGLEAVLRRCLDAQTRLDAITGGADEGIRWIDVTTRRFSLHLTPFDTSEQLRRIVDARHAAFVMTSATLAVADDFSHFLARLGVPHATTLKLDSPFDYSRNALLFLPSKMPNPADETYTDRVVDAAKPVLAASGGRAFLLFTSHRALRRAAERLRAGGESSSQTLLVQGDAPRDELLTRFRRLGNATLLGTSSFWEGVDVRGDALRVVVIDKLPFASPGEPVVKARIAAIRASGGQPFRDYQLPQAVLALKQGVGRLIRDVTDTGVCMICDPRLTTRGYGRTFLRSLPPMPVTDSLEEVVDFLNLNGAAAL